MLSFITNIFSRGSKAILSDARSLKNISALTNKLYEIFVIFDQEYANDKDAKNAAIDSIIKLLEAHKDGVSKT
jgi:hypothetical protein